MKLADLYVELRAKGLARLQHNLDKLHSRLGGLSRYARRAFLGMAGAISGAVYAAAKFEKQMAMVSTMLSEADMRWMGPFAKGVRRLSVELGESTATLSKGLYDILSASVAPAEALDVLRASAKAAAAGMTSTAVAADAITTILNSYRLPASKAAEISDKLFATVKRGKLTFEQLASSIGKAAATAAVSGLKLEELLAAISTITRAGINADQAMTAVVGILRSFLKPTDEAKELAKELGFEMSTATLKAEGLAGVFERINNLSAEQVAALFPNIRGLKGVAAALKDLSGYYRDVALISSAAGMSQEAYAKTTKTFAFRLNQLKQAFKDLGVQLGEALLPALKEAVDWLSNLTGTLKGMPSVVQKGAVAFTALTAALAALRPAIKGLKGLLVILGSIKGLVVSLILLVTELTTRLAKMAKVPGMMSLSEAIEEAFKLWGQHTEAKKREEEAIARFYEAHDKIIAGRRTAKGKLSPTAKLMAEVDAMLEKWRKKKRMERKGEGILTEMFVGFAGTDLEKALLRIEQWRDQMLEVAEKYGLDVVKIYDWANEQRLKAEDEFNRRMKEKAERLAAERNRIEMEGFQERRRRLDSMMDVIYRSRYGGRAAALRRLLREITNVGRMTGVEKEYFEARLQEIMKGFSPRGGRWMGMADLWRRLQSAALSPEVKELKITNKLLKMIHEKIGQPVVVE